MISPQPVFHYSKLGESNMFSTSNIPSDQKDPVKRSDQMLSRRRLLEIRVRQVLS